MEDKALVDTLDKTLKRRTPRHLATHCAMSLTEMDAKTLGDTLGDVKTVELVDTLAHTLAEPKAKTVDNKIFNEKAEALIEMLVVTPLEVKP